MNDLRTIQMTLERVSKRRRAASAIAGLWWGVLAGAIVSFLIAGSYKLLPIHESVLYWAAATPIIGAIAGTVIGAWRSPTQMQMARWLDAQQHLQERLSTALETADHPSADKDPWRELVLKDAAACAGALDPKRAISFHVARAGRWAALILLITSCLGLVPAYRSKEHLQAKRDAEVIKETARRLAEVTRREMEKRPPALESTREALEATATLAEKLSASPPERDQALRELANAAEKLKQTAEEISKSSVPKQLQRAANANGGTLKSPAELQKQINAMKEQLGSAAATPEQLKQMHKDLAEAKQAAQAASGQSPSGADMKSKVSPALADLASQADALGLELPSLDEAIAALAADQTGQFLKQMDAALLDLEKLAEMAQAIQAMQQEAGELGKNLAEQLSKGQAQAARETLEALAEKLKSGAISKQDLQKILEEVSKAIDPASQYGEVAKHLQAASEQMKNGRQNPAGSSLKEAADELAKLMQQAADAQAAMAEIQALQQASMCIGTGRTWSPGMLAQKRGGQGPGGPGVGMWNDAQESWDGSMGEMPDNSGFSRPDMDSRSDLAEAEKGPDLTPTKVTGQFSPGGQMPSITLRGVGIKGQSKVAYEEAATAAQSEAQTALGQDKVPRAYRETVKNYFDDLKN